MSYIGNIPKFSNYVPDYFDGTGLQTTFILSNAPPGNGSIIVIIDGVKQLANTYNVSGTSLILSEAPSIGTKIEVNFLALKAAVVEVKPTTGGGTDSVFFLNDQIMTEDFTIPAGKNAGVFGPLTIATGKTLTIPDNCTLTIC